jgi:hypothetical protein
MRVAILDSNGVPSPGSENLYVTNALATMDVTHVYTDGSEIEDKNACDEVLVNYRGDDSFKRADVALTILTTDPYLQAFLSAGAVLEGFDGDRVGYGAPFIGPVTTPGVSIELWSKRIDDGDLDADSPYAWWVYPKVKNLRLGNHQHANVTMRPAFSGQAYENPNWFDGPLNDWPAASDRVWQWVPTDTLPDINCGPLELAAS